jgi:hypothetical protein
MPYTAYCASRPDARSRLDMVGNLVAKAAAWGRSEAGEAGICVLRHA